jgi:hypothetical protein
MGTDRKLRDIVGNETKQQLPSSVTGYWVCGVTGLCCPLPKFFIMQISSVFLAIWLVCRSYLSDTAFLNVWKYLKRHIIRDSICLFRSLDYGKAMEVIVRSWVIYDRGRYVTRFTTPASCRNATSITLAYNDSLSVQKLDRYGPWWKIFEWVRIIQSKLYYHYISIM